MIKRADRRIELREEDFIRFRELAVDNLSCCGGGDAYYKRIAKGMLRAKADKDGYYTFDYETYQWVIAQLELMYAV